MDQNFALHETLELHEMAAFKAVCLTKSKTTRILVTDPELTELMNLDVEMSTRHLRELDGLLARAVGGEVRHELAD